MVSQMRDHPIDYFAICITYHPGFLVFPGIPENAGTSRICTTFHNFEHVNPPPK